MVNLLKKQNNISEPNWSTSLPRFCTRCGDVMVSKPMKTTTFNSITGELVHEYYWRCIKIKWWYNFSFSIHDEFHVIERPDYKIGQYSYRGVLTIMRNF